MRLRVLLPLALLLATMGCRRRPPRVDDLPPLSRALLAVARDLGDPPTTSEQGDVERLTALAATARAALATGPTVAPALALNESVFGTAGIEREVDDQALRFVLLPSVLEARRGSCVGLGTLYLALAELAGVTARGVLVPGHFYVQVRQGAGWRNVELLRRGDTMPDAWYRTRYGAPAGEVAGTALSPNEVVGVIAYDIGNERRRQGRIGEARRAFERAVREFPDLAEAHASLGAMLQLLGDLDAADAAYATARHLDPALPGLERNVEILEAERAARRKL